MYTHPPALLMHTYRRWSRRTKDLGAPPEVETPASDSFSVMLCWGVDGLRMSIDSAVCVGGSAASMCVFQFTPQTFAHLLSCLDAMG